MAPIEYTAIGILRSPYTALDGMPLQTVAAPEVEGRVELEPAVHGALRDLDGFSLVQLVAVETGVLHVRGIDLLDGTPILDVKPYVPLFDARENARPGWFAEAGPRVHHVRTDRRYEG